MHKELANLSPSEAVLQVFNVLFPYPKALPIIPDDNEIDAFFGKINTSRNNSEIKSDDARVSKLQQQLYNSDSKIFDLQQTIYALEKRVQELQFGLESKTQENDFSLKIIKELRDKQTGNLKNSDEITKIKLDYDKSNTVIESLKSQIMDLSAENDELKGKLDENAYENPEIIDKLTKENRAFRVKAGLVFLKGLENSGKSAADPEVQLQDDETLKRLEHALADNPPSFRNRLTDIDINKDGKITKAELTKVLAKLVIVPQDIIVILRVAGFRQGVNIIPIDDIAKLLENRLETRLRLENELFERLAEYFRNSNLNLEQAFQFIDINKDGFVNFQEMSEAVETIGLSLSREDRHAVFAVLDSDHNGYISLEEFKARLDQVKIVAKPKPQNPRKIETPINLVKETAISKPLQTELPNSQLKSNPISEIASQVVSKNKLNVKKINGSLVIGVVRGRNLNTADYAIKMSLNGSEKILMTPFMPGPEPDWKYKGRIRLYDTNISQVSNEIMLELINQQGYVASCKTPWLPTLENPNYWAIKSEFPLTDTKNSKFGSLIVHLMWMPKDTVRVEGSGHLSLQILSISGFIGNLAQVSIGDCNAMIDLKPLNTLTIKDINLKGDEPVPSMKFSILSKETRQTLIWRNLSIEPAVISQD